jgi:hypothetical protein
MLARTTRLLVGLCVAAGVLAGVPLASAAAAQPFAVRTSLDGLKTLPSRIHWTVHPALPADQVLEVDFVIDGKVRWAETDAPFVYGGHWDGGRYPGYLVTTFLTAGTHRFGVRVTDNDGRVATHTTVAHTGAAPEPPAELQGMWTRMVSNADLTKSDPAFGNPPPMGTWRLVFDHVGLWELDSTGAGVVEQDSVSPGVLSVYAPIQQAPSIEDHTATSRYGAHNIGGNLCNPTGPFGRYSWTVTGAGLTLTATSELCPDRRAVLEGTWTRVG